MNNFEHCCALCNLQQVVLANTKGRVWFCARCSQITPSIDLSTIESVEVSE